MTRHSQAKRLPNPVLRDLAVMGDQIKLARKRRRISIAALAERAQCSELSVIRAERGNPTVSIGIYARLLYGLGLHGDLLLIARDDPAGRALVDARILSKNKREENDDDLFD